MEQQPFPGAGIAKIKERWEAAAAASMIVDLPASRQALALLLYSDEETATRRVVYPPYHEHVGARTRLFMRLQRYDCGSERLVWRQRLAGHRAALVDPAHAHCPLCGQQENVTVAHLLLLCTAPEMVVLRYQMMVDVADAVAKWAARGSPLLVPLPIHDERQGQEWQDRWMRVLLGGCTARGATNVAALASQGLAACGLQSVPCPDQTTVHFVDLSSTRYDSMLGRIRAQAMRNVVLRLTGQFIQQCDLRYCNAMVAAGL